MSVSAVQTAYPIIEQSSKMAEEAALEINTHPPLESAKNNSYEFNKVEFKPPKANEDYAEALTKLTQASQYSRIGTNALQREQDMIGTLLDIHV